MDFTKVKIDKSTPIPLYYQLKSIISEAINNGDLKPGDSLPTEAEFSEMFDLSRTTIRQAIGELVMEGSLHRIKSKGTFVSKPKIHQRFMQNLESFSAQMHELNLTPRIELIERDIIDPPKDVAEALSLKNGDKVIYTYRRRYANEEPIVLVKNYFVTECADLIMNADLTQVSLYETAFQCEETHIHRFIREIQAVLTDSYMAHMLNVKVGHPALHATSVGYNKAGRAVEYAVVDYRGDKNVFVVEFEVDK